ncbi:hypothetical protein [Microbulbifer pacificus]|uniref:Uncharacterized protein n=1 Tax=Microbulbifer pacificus TaxID=407164 RepID=A0AAU0N1Q1_9GAMM|nr:hypothetical protein [Microbulbifer pacificus]WOX06177.1 hypothetical protein R5R33_03300 [Microbulbifer pacificus]
MKFECKFFLLSIGLVLSVGAFGQNVVKKVELVAAHETVLLPLMAQSQELQDQAAKPAEPSPLIWVFRHRRVKQCQGEDMSLDESRAKLKESGVAAHESHCGFRTDQVFLAGCGEPTGRILLHLIRANALDAAIDAGYGPAEQITYQKVECTDEATP